MQEPSPDPEALLDSLGAVVWEGDPTTMRFRFVSHAAERIFGYPASAWTDSADFFVSHIHPDDRDQVVSFCREETLAGRDHEIEYRMFAADGRIVCVRDIVRVICEGGRPQSSRGVLVDVSDRKQAEEALRVAEERLRFLVGNAPVVLFAVDRRGVVTHCEGRGLEAIGMKPSEVLGRSLAELFANEDRIRLNLLRSLAGESFSDVVVYRGHSFETRYTAVRNAEGEVEGLTGVGTDVTERVHAERERQRLDEQVRHAQRLESLGSLAGGIAHDFNNLLMTILGSADLAAAGLAPDSPEHGHVERIRATARRAAELTQQLLTYAGRSQVAVRPLDLGALVQSMLELVEVSIPKRASLRVELEPGLPAVEGNPAQLAQVVLNLLTNAAEALGDEPGRIAVRTQRVDLRAEDLAECVIREGIAPGPFVCLEVEDTGKGLDEATRSKVFDPFFSTKFPGRGLGLATVLGVVRGHRGTLRVRSAPGDGASFQVLIPPSGQVAAAAEPSAPSAAGWRGRGTVLVVDDEADVREIAEAMLRHFGFQVRTARHGREGLELLRAPGSEFAAVVLDITMPEMSGEQALRELRRIRPDVPVVVMSGFDERHACSALLAGGQGAYLQKPFDSDQLAAALKEVLGPAQTPGSG